MNKPLDAMSIYEIKIWLKLNVSSQWSNRDIDILSEVLYCEYQKNKISGNKNRTDREYFTKMLLKGKLHYGIAPDQ